LSIISIKPKTKNRSYLCEEYSSGNISFKKSKQTDKEKLPVIIEKHNTQILGHATHLAALNAYNKSLIHAHEEEHK
jgi:hypothetical protein